MRFWTEDAADGRQERMVLTSGGNVGVGTSSPSAKLHIREDQDDITRLRVENQNETNNAYAQLSVRTANNSSFVQSYGTSFSSDGMFESGSTALWGNGFNGVNIGATTANVAGGISFWTGGTADSNRRMTITNTGNVGIGTTTPSSQLTVQAVAGTSALNIASSTGESLLYVNEDGNVGIGTTTPTDLLHVFDSSTATRILTENGNSLGEASVVSRNDIGAQIGLAVFGSGNTLTLDGVSMANRAMVNTGGSSDGTMLRTTGDLYFNTVSESGIEMILQGSTGNLGIGTTTPTRSLSVNGDSSDIIADFASTDTAALIAFSDNGTATNFSTRLGAVGEDFALFTGGAQRFTMLGNGDVGIGTSTPGDAFHLFLADSGGIDTSTIDGFVIENNDTTGIDILTPDANTGRINFGSPANSRNAAIWSGNNSSNPFLSLRTNNVERVRIDQSGNFGIGTSSPEELLHLSSDGSTVRALFTNDTTGYTATDGFYVGLNAAQTRPQIWNYENSDIVFGTQNTEVLRIKNGGNIGISTTTPSAQLTVDGTVRFATITGGTLETDALGNVTVSSDERLKDIVGAYAAGLDEVLALNPIEYRWNEESGYDMSTLYAGFSAQNVESVIPEAVGENGDGFKTLSTRPILAAVVTAVGEIWSAITGNTEAIESLESENQELRERLEAVEAELDIVAPASVVEEDVPEDEVMEETATSTATSTDEMIVGEEVVAGSTESNVDEVVLESEEIVDPQIEEAVVEDDEVVSESEEETGSETATETADLVEETLEV